MKRVELVSLRLEHFMGVESFELSLDGRDATVRATNGAGKTTLATAFSWLLTGKDSRGQAEFEIKTLDAAGEALHNLEHTVEAVLRIGGETVKLRRAFVEVWTQKRGSTRDEFTGHESKFWIDDVPCGTKREFDERVAELVPAAAWRELTNPDAWHAQHWQKRRADLIDICGDVTTADVIAANPDLAALPEVLGKRSPEEHKKVLEARRREINSELKTVPARIDEVQIQLTELPEVDAAVEARLVTARAERDELAEELARVKAGGGDATAERRRLAEVERSLTELDLKGEREKAQREREAQAALDAARRDLEGLEHRRERLQEQARQHEEDAAAVEPKLVSMRAEWARVSGRTFEGGHVPDSCPACGQGLPAEQVDAAHAKAREEFNAAQAKALADLNAEGAALRQRQEAHEKAAAAARQDAEALDAEVAQAQGKVKNLEGKLAAAQAAPVQDATGSGEYAALRQEADELIAAIASVHAADPAAITSAQERLAAADAVVAGLQRDLSLQCERERAEARKEQLLEQEARLSSEAEKLAGELHLIEQFVRAKSRALTDKINSRFAITRFSLFEEQLNGGLTDTCVATVAGVPYGAGLNRAARINSGLDVIQVLQEHHGVLLPVFVDECESVVDLHPLPTQVVRLVVDDRHAALHVELEPKKEQVAA